MSLKFEITSLFLSDAKVLTRSAKIDERGCLERYFCKREIGNLIGSREVVQINRTLTKASGTVRGLHFQYPPHSEFKIVSCLNGEVFDVMVDLRIDSPTFLKWHTEILSGTNRKTLLIPEGFAHGFQTLTNDVEMLYMHTNYYNPESEGGIRYDDPALGIKWPKPIECLSARDENHIFINSDFVGLRV